MQREIFVFGSNRAGRHGRGAALFAAQRYGAQRGVGEGLTGDAYALPTKGERLELLPFSEIDAAICRFLKIARETPDARFLLTPVGTGLAGHKKADVWGVLKREGLPANVVLTSSWVTG
tara:strand:+ start:5912 stop:6268 length:357 start_codon:yes stop_codon:yes gene_type:complete